MIAAPFLVVTIFVNKRSLTDDFILFQTEKPPIKKFSIQNIVS